VKKTALVVISIAALALAGCKDKPKTEAPAAPQQGQAPGGDPHAGMKAQEVPAGAGKKATVTQTMNTAGYTYVEAADAMGVKVWLALPEVKVAKGDKIEYLETPPLSNFQSKTLNRTFEKISFVPGIRILK
jgi:nitrous oxide reductase accessory protein NosL